MKEKISKSSSPRGNFRRQRDECLLGGWGKRNRSKHESIWFISSFSFERWESQKNVVDSKKREHFSTVCILLTNMHTHRRCSSLITIVSDSLDRKFKFVNSIECRRRRKTVSENFPANCTKWINAWIFYLLAGQTELLNTDSNALRAARLSTGFFCISEAGSIQSRSLWIMRNWKLASQACN